MQTERVYIADGYGLEACLVNDAALNFRHEYVQCRAKNIDIHVWCLCSVHVCIYNVYMQAACVRMCVRVCACRRVSVYECVSINVLVCIHAD